MTPLLTLSRFYMERAVYAALLKQIEPVLAPLEQASPGDVVAILVDLAFTDQGRIHLSPIHRFIEAGEGGGQLRSWEDLCPGHRLYLPLAVLFSSLATKANITSAVQIGVNAFSSSEGNWEKITLILTRQGFAFMADDFARAILPHVTLGSDIPQSAVDDCLALVLPRTASRHEDLGLGLQPCLLGRMLLDVFPIRWNEQTIAVEP